MCSWACSTSSLALIFLWCRIAHDCTIPAVLQSTSLRLLYNLIETIFQRRADARTSESYRSLLSGVLECFVRKLGALRSQVTHVIRCEERVMSPAVGAHVSLRASQTL